jgi:hypothetical protein
MKPSQVYEFMKEFYEGADKVSFSWMDCNNEIGHERRKYLESNDTNIIGILEGQAERGSIIFLRYGNR